MDKSFTISVPDQPYRNSYLSNKSVDCHYIGPDFLIVAIESATNCVAVVLNCNDDINELGNIEDYNLDGHYMILLDTRQHPFESAYITRWYISEKIESYQEVLPTGETWIYEYNENAILGHIYQFQTMYYDKSTGKFSEPLLIEGPFTRESYFEGMNNQIQQLKSVRSQFTGDELKAINNALDWLENIEKNYPNVDHWKIPFPDFNLPSF